MDGASGQDSAECGESSAPCQTISHTLGIRAASGDTIRVAQGIYTENLTIDKQITLEGGYESSGWSRNVVDYATMIDGSAGQTVIGDWDGSELGKPAVLSDGAEFKMWCDGQDVLGAQQIAMATSTDGITWTKYLTNPVLMGETDTWDEFGEHAPFIIRDGGTYKMWYEGNAGSVRQLGYATSSDSITWTKHAGNPVLAAGPESYDKEAAGHGSIIHDESAYKLWYHAIGDLGPIIAYATSVDGVNWTKQGPVLLPQSGEWDEFALWGPSVLMLDGMYWMWYSAAGQMPPSIGVVTSTNGITWTRFLTGPVLSRMNGSVGHSHVISDSGKLKMWYQDNELGVINYAESSDGVTWTKSPGNPVLSPGTLVTEWGKPVVSVQADKVVLDGFTITGGSAQYAGGVETGTDTTVRSCTIRDNFADGSPNSQGGGILAFAGEPLTVTNSQILGNRVNQGAGGIRAGDSTLVMTNTIVADNRGDFALHLNDSAILWNDTLVNNDEGVLFNADGKPDGKLEVTNSIIYSNRSTIADPAGAVLVTYSDIEGGWTGTGNITDTPTFVDPVNGDYRLAPTSAVVDAGTNEGAPSTDFEGDPRPVDGTLDGTAVTDMEADEYVPIRHFLPSILSRSGP